MSTQGRAWHALPRSGRFRAAAARAGHRTRPQDSPGPRGPSRTGRDRQRARAAHFRAETGVRGQDQPPAGSPGLSLPLRGTAAVVSAPQGQEVVPRGPGAPASALTPPYTQSGWLRHWEQSDASMM